MKRRIISVILIIAMALSVSTFGICSSAASAFPFGDVTAKRWSNPYIVLMYNEGVVSGMTENAFVPAANVTRAQFVTLLGGLAKIDKNAQSSVTKFTDVPQNKWYTPYVAWASENGVVSGVTDTTFNPDGNIKRQEMAAMIYRYVKLLASVDGTESEEKTEPDMYMLPTVNDKIDFTDIKAIDSWAQDAMYVLQRANIISGISNGDGTLRCEPKSTATREQACKMLADLYCIIYGTTLPAPVEPPPYKITYNLNGGVASGLKYTYNGDDSFTLPTPARSGYEFLGWSGTGIWKVSKNVKIQKNSYGDRSYTANWSEIKYKITYNLNGGTIKGAPQTYTINTETFSIPVPTRSGYTFTGWRFGNSKTATMTYTVKKGTVGWISLTATWARNATNEEKEIWRLINNQRGKYGLPALTYRPDIQNCADIRRNEITSYFSNVRPNGTEFTSVLTDAGVEWNVSGENILSGEGLPTEIVQYLMSYSYENILSSDYTGIAIGITEKGGYKYWELLFIG